MLGKTTRFLIAAPSLRQRLFIEQNLNDLGHYRIAMASSYEEACKLTQVSSCPIEVLIIEQSLASTCGGEMPEDELRARHILRYRNRQERLSTRLSWEDHRLYVLKELPDSQSLSRLLQIVHALDPTEADSVHGG